MVPNLRSRNALHLVPRSKMFFWSWVQPSCWRRVAPLWFEIVVPATNVCTCFFCWNLPHKKTPSPQVISCIYIFFRYGKNPHHFPSSIPPNPISSPSKLTIDESWKNKFQGMLQQLAHPATFASTTAGACECSGLFCGASGGMNSCEFFVYFTTRYYIAWTG